MQKAFFLPVGPPPSQAYFITFVLMLGLGWSKMWFKNGLEPPGVIFPKYGPVASHGDPIRVQNEFLGGALKN